MATHAYWDYGAAENVSLICRLAKCYFLFAFDDMADFAKIAALRVIEIGHRPPRPIQPVMLCMDF
jgi:hypothetical protein